MSQISPLKGYILIICAALLFGTTGTAQMLGAVEVAPWIIGAFRLIIGGPVLLAAALIFGPRHRGPGHLSGYAMVLGASLGVVIFQFTFFEALARTGVATGTLVAVGSGPVMVGILGAVCFKERLDRAWGLATALALAGCAFLAVSGRGVEMDGAGILLALASGSGYAIYVVAGRGLVRIMAPAKAVGLILTFGAVIMVPFVWFADLTALVSPRVGLTLGYMGLFATALSYFLLTRGLTAVPVAPASVLMLLEPLVGALLGICILGEPVTFYSGTGMVLIFSGMMVIAKNQFHRSPASALSGTNTRG